MEASTKPVFKVAMLVSMFVLCVAARAPSPEESKESATTPSPEKSQESMITPSAEESDTNPNKLKLGSFGKILGCAKRCGLSCIEDGAGTSPIAYGGCFSMCMITCRNSGANTMTLACSLNCARSATNSIEKDTPIKGVEHFTTGYGDACFESCSKNKNLY